MTPSFEERIESSLLSDASPESVVAIWAEALAAGRSGLLMDWPRINRAIKSFYTKDFYAMRGRMYRVADAAKATVNVPQ